MPLRAFGLSLDASPAFGYRARRSATNTRAVTKQVSVTGPITVQTQAKDGDEVASALSNNLASHLRGAVDETDDGVAA